MGAQVLIRLEHNLKLKAIYQRVAKLPPVDAGHAFDHTERVAKWCARLLTEEHQARELPKPTDTQIDAAWAVGLLHDCVPISKNSALRSQSAELCAREAKVWLSEINWEPNSSVTEIAEAIEDHSYSSGRIPRSLLGEVLQDADRLEALGAIGLYRTIATGVSMGCVLFDPADPWAERRELDDQRFTVDHFFTKLLKLPATFRTQAAKHEAQKRADYLYQFVEQLKLELK